MLVAGNTAGDEGGYAGFAGYAAFGARVRAKRVPPSRAVKGLQSALRLLARAARDGRLSVGTDGRVGGRTVAAVNIAFTRHIGGGQAPAALRTGRLTAADVAKNAQTLGVLVLTEVKRRRAAAVTARRVPPPAGVRRPRRPMQPGTIVPGPRMGPMPGPGPDAGTMTPSEFAPDAAAAEAPAPETMTPPEFAPEAAAEEAPPARPEEAAAEEAPAEEAPAEEAAAEEAPAEGGGEEAPAEEAAETAGAVGGMSMGNKVVLSTTILGLFGGIGFGLWHMSKTA
jgi:hypothetical protein